MDAFLDDDDAIHSSNGTGGVTLSAVHIDNPEGDGWDAPNLVGVNLIDNNTLIENINTSNTHAVNVTNTNTNLTSLTVENSTFEDQPAANGATYFDFDLRGTSNMTSTGTMNTTIQRNAFRNAQGTLGENGVSVASAWQARQNAIVDNNIVINVSKGVATSSAIGSTVTGSSIMDAEWTNNDIDTIPNQGGISLAGEQDGAGAGLIDVQINDNVIDGVGDKSISVTAFDLCPDMDVEFSATTSA